MMSEKARLQSEKLKLAITDLKLEVVHQRLELLLKRFDPNQLRAPKGEPDGGQWVNNRTRVASRERLTDQECDDLFDKDTFHCRMVGLRSCHAQAASRYSDCINGFTIRPLSY